MPQMKPTDVEIREWRNTGYSYKLIAAAIAEWATTQERGTALFDDAFFERRTDIYVSASTWRRAKRFLVTQGVLVNDGHLSVALAPERRKADCPGRTAGHVVER